MTGYVIAERKIDDNGNWYYQQLEQSVWATPELAEQHRRAMSLGGVVVSTEQPRLDDGRDLAAAIAKANRGA